ncbi:MAG: hypothetical protein LBL37_06000 [Gracilibacteraceae bacterium]|nr:hypothetical protein [Gracilibacteraceae bacterium]
MNQFFSIIINTLRARFVSLWTKARYWLSPTFWRTKGVQTLRAFFTRLFDFKPRHKNDYYGMLRWLVSKRLAFAAIVIVGVMAVWYVYAMSPLSPREGEGGGAAPTYRYKSLALKFYSGEARILDAADRTAFVGMVGKGRANGPGTLYDPDGGLMYVGEFKNSMYEGQGETYYPGGAVRYKGMFSQNLFQGGGAYYRPEGTVEYEGEFAGGSRQGAGALYNAGGNLVFSGNFQMGRIVFEEFIGKTTAAATAMYSGRVVSYNGADEYAVHMSDINAVYESLSGEQSLDEEWKIGRVYVLTDTFVKGGAELSAISDIKAVLGAPAYLGETWLTLPDAVALNQSEQDALAPVAMETRPGFEDVYSVDSYDENRRMYIYVFPSDGFVYTFYCESGTAPGFLFYSAE